MKLGLLIFGIPALAMAHHGQDFFVTLDPTVPRALSGVAFSSFEWAQHGVENELNFEPGILLGLGGGIAVGAAAELSAEGSGKWEYSGVSPSFQYSIPTGDLPFSLAMSARYTFANDSPTDDEQHNHQHHGGGPGPIIDLGPDAPPPTPVGGGTSHSHDHGGIHLHGEDHLQVRLIAEVKIGSATRLVGNFISVTPPSGGVDLGYAMGLRQQITQDWALGLENIGDLAAGGEHTVIAGVFWSASHHCVIRLGAGTGLGGSTGDFSVHSGLVWRF